jgi:type II secretory pathway component GspD/PulD (secretin)
MRLCWLMCIVAASFAAGSSAATSAWGEEPTAGGSMSLELAIVDVKRAALGTAEPTAAKVLELAQSGKADSSSLLKLSLLENLPATVQFSETVPVVSGRTDFGGRGATNNVTMQNVGTMVQATARIEKSDQVVVELKAERSRIVPISPEADPSMPGSTKTMQATVATTTRQISGVLTIVGSQTTGGGDSQVHTFFILTARVPPTAQAAVEPAAIPVLKVFALANAQASELVKTLQPMFEGQKIRLAADDRSNALIVHGTPEVIEVAAELIKRLDES